MNQLPEKFLRSLPHLNNRNSHHLSTHLVKKFIQDTSRPTTGRQLDRKIVQMEFLSSTVMQPAIPIRYYISKKKPPYICFRYGLRVRNGNAAEGIISLSLVISWSTCICCGSSSFCFIHFSEKCEITGSQFTFCLFNYLASASH